MKKAYLVTFAITTRVIADTQEEAEKLAVIKAKKTAIEDIALDNWESTEEDIENPIDRDDIEFLLFPNLQSLTPEQEEEVTAAYYAHLKEQEGSNTPKKERTWLLDMEEAAIDIAKAEDVWSIKMSLPTLTTDENGMMVVAERELVKLPEYFISTKNIVLPDSVTHTLEVSQEGKKESIVPDILTPDFIKNNLGKVFATGISNENILEGTPTQWVAKVSNGDASWAIYYGPIQTDVDWICRCGLKIKLGHAIRHLVPCDDHAFKMYRY